MTASRFDLPAIGGSSPIMFPPISRDRLPNGLGLWSIAHTSVPVVTAQILLRCGAADDPHGRPGVAGMTADMLDEAAGTRDAIELAEAFARLGSSLTIEVGADVTTLGVTSLARHFPAVLALLADVVIRPRFEPTDLERVRELRLSRLRQLSSTAGASADRTFFHAVFGPHPYGHGVLGTTASLQEIALDDVRAFHATQYRPGGAILVVAGDLDRSTIVDAAAAAFGSWPAGTRPEAASPGGAPDAPASTGVLFVARPRATQSELRVGHGGPARDVDAYHALLTLNAALGGQFSSRLNSILREKKGLTYGVHTAFDFRRAAGTFACETSVQADGTAVAIADILAEFEAIRVDGSLTDDELDRAKAALTRGYVRHFETADQLVRAAVQLAVHGLDDRTFDRFVPLVEGVSVADAVAAARRFIHPDRATVVVVGDPDVCRAPIEALGRAVTIATPEF